MERDELMKPRYKVIADYPGMLYNVGDIFYQHNVDVESWGVERFYTVNASKVEVENVTQRRAVVPIIESFPHLFRKLEWWEERADMLPGMYVRFGDVSKAHSFYKIIDRLNGDLSFWNMEGGRGSGLAQYKYCYPLHGSTPATEAEYLAFTTPAPSAD